MNTKNMVVAAKEFKINDDDGLLYLDHLSVAMFVKDKGDPAAGEPKDDGDCPEINTYSRNRAPLSSSIRSSVRVKRTSAAAASLPPN